MEEEMRKDQSSEAVHAFATSTEYPECPNCKGITYHTFDHQTVKTYYKCHKCGYESKREDPKR